MTVLTAQLVKGLLRVCVSVAALANVIGLQLNGGLDGGDWLLAGLQVHAGKEGQAPCARLVLDPLIKSCPPRLGKKRKQVLFGSNMTTKIAKSLHKTIISFFVFLPIQTKPTK